MQVVANVGLCLWHLTFFFFFFFKFSERQKPRLIFEVLGKVFQGTAQFVQYIPPCFQVFCSADISLSLAGLKGLCCNHTEKKHRK